MSVKPALRNPSRSAHASVRGYFYQAALSVQRWLELDDDESLICEGNEDIDRILLSDDEETVESRLEEQVKNHSSSLNICDEPVSKSLGNFLTGYVTLRKQDEEASFVFSTTASRRRQRLSGTAAVDLLEEWSNESKRDEVVEGIRDRVDVEDDVLEWMDDNEAWDAFIDSVEWRFELPGRAEVRQTCRDLLEAAFPDAAPSDLLELRLLAAVFETTSRPTAELRQLDRQKLGELVSEGRESIEAWLEEHDVVPSMLGDVVARELDDRECRKEDEALRKLLKTRQNLLHPDVEPRPGELLRAENEVVPFTGRHKELEELDHWFYTDERKPSVGFRFYAGEGGAGKTRLMLEWCNRLRDRGEYAGFLDRSGPGGLDAFFGGVGRRVAVIDYAEARPELLRALVEKIEDWRHQKPERRGRLQIRVVLLARKSPEDGEWWQRLEALLERREWGLIDRNLHLRTRALDELLPEVSDRRVHFADAVERFGAVMGRAKEEFEAPKLEAEHFGHPLYVQMAGFAALFGKQLSGAGDLLDEVLKHEKDYWNKRVTNEDLSGRKEEEALQCAENTVVLLSLWDGVADDELKEVVRLSFPGASGRGQAHIPTNLVKIVQELVREFYSEDSEESGALRRLRGLEPDVLGEHLINRQFEKAEHVRGIKGPRLLKNAIEEADDSQRRSTLRVLTQLAQRRPAAKKWLKCALSGRLEELGPIAMKITLEMGDPLGNVLAEVFEDEGDSDLAGDLRRAVSGHATPLTEIWIKSAKQILKEHKETYQNVRLVGERLRTRLRLLNELANAYNDAADFSEQLRFLKRAESLTAKFRPDSQKKKLETEAVLFSNMGTALAGLGRHRKAVELTEEACQKYAKYRAEYDESCFIEEAKSVGNLSNRYAQLGRKRRASEVARRALDLHRRVDANTSENIARALSNLSVRLWENGEHGLAVNRVEEALTQVRKLHDRLPQKYAPLLAWVLNNLGLNLSALGESETAMERLDESVEEYLVLFQVRPRKYALDLARALVNRSDCARNEGKMSADRTDAREAVETCRAFIDLPAAPLMLAEALVHFARAERQMGDYQSASEHVAEALTLYREGVRDRPRRFWEDLADASEWSAELCEELGRDDEADERVREAESLREEYGGSE